jgi:hypothetical protein
MSFNIYLLSLVVCHMYVVSCNNFHIIGPATGKAYMISIPWLLDSGGSSDEGSTTAIVVYDKPNRIIPSSAVGVANKENEGLAGVAVVADPTLGHVALFRSSDGFMSAMNMTVQLRLVQLEKHLKVRSTRQHHILIATIPIITYIIEY